MGRMHLAGPEERLPDTAGGVRRIGYLIPEWPGQSHVWAWREISALRGLGLDVAIFSTRRPPAASMGQHAFAPGAIAQTTYLWPPRLDRSLACSIWFGLVRPRRVAACFTLALRMPSRSRRDTARRLALIVPALRLAEHVHRAGIKHLHTPIPAESAVLCMMARRLADVPYSLAVVNQLSDWGDGLALKMQEARFATLVAEYLRRDAVKAFPGLAQEKLRVVRHGVDTVRWQPRSAQPIQPHPHQKILAIGRLTHAKGFDVLIDAFAILRTHNVLAQLEIIGEGPERDNLESQIDRLELHNLVQLRGSCGEEDCLASMQGATVFALASRHEGTPVVCMEAMASGIPVVAASVGGIPEIIQDGVNGLLVSPNSAVHLAVALERLLSSVELQQQLAAEARTAAIERFDSVVGAKALMELLCAAPQNKPA